MLSTADAQPTYEVVEVVGYTVAEVGGREVMASCSSRGDAERVAMALGRRRASAKDTSKESPWIMSQGQLIEEVADLREALRGIAYAERNSEASDWQEYAEEMQERALAALGASPVDPPFDPGPTPFTDVARGPVSSKAKPEAVAGPCPECKSAGLPEHFKRFDDAETCATYLAHRDREDSLARPRSGSASPDYREMYRELVQHIIPFSGAAGSAVIEAADRHRAAWEAARCASANRDANVLRVKAAGLTYMAGGLAMGNEQPNNHVVGLDTSEARPVCAKCGFVGGHLRSCIDHVPEPRSGEAKIEGIMGTDKSFTVRTVGDGAADLNMVGQAVGLSSSPTQSCTANIRAVDRDEKWVRLRLNLDRDDMRAWAKAIGKDVTFTWETQFTSAGRSDTPSPSPAPGDAGEGET